MEIKQIETQAIQAIWDSVIEIECPNCETTIIAEPNATAIYCEECKCIVLQNPLTEPGLI